MSDSSAPIARRARAADCRSRPAIAFPGWSRGVLDPGPRWSQGRIAGWRSVPTGRKAL